jgi:tyrosine-protein phosphatase 2/3
MLRVIRLQYLGWPDVNVPDDADGLLWLIDAVNEATAAAAAVSPPASPGPAPVLLHCSAGVGRTGAFIAVDAVLDSLRRELRSQSRDTMQVDDRSPSTSGSSPNQSGTPSSNSHKSKTTPPPQLAFTQIAPTPAAAAAVMQSHLPTKRFNLALPVAGKPGRLMSRTGSNSSATNGYSSNPRIFDSAGQTSGSSSSATDLDSARGDDVVMSDKDTHAEGN